MSRSGLRVRVTGILQLRRERDKPGALEPAAPRRQGWFALKTIPDSWADAGPTDDGLHNYVNAGPGLGTGDDPEELLDKIPDVMPLRTAGLGSLVDTTVCALVHKSDISINYDPLNGSLKGDTRGLIAFDVLSVKPISSSEHSP